MLMKYKSIPFCMLLIILFSTTLSQSNSAQNQQQNNTSSIIMFIGGSQTVTIMQNGSYMSEFIEVAAQSHFYSCAEKNLYTFFQSKTQLNQNLPYYIYYSIANSNNTFFHVSTVNNIVPTTGTMSSASTTTLTILEMFSNCSNINYIEYFDRIKVQVSGFQTISFDFVCYTSYYNQTFSLGAIIQVGICTVLVSIFAFFGRAWSIKGAGIQLKWFYVVGINLLIIALYILIYFFINVMVIVYDIFGWLLGLASIWLCSNEILFSLRIKGFNAGFKIRKVKFRLMDFMSAILAVMITATWYFGNKNWISNDIIFICATAMVVKIVKFTSLKSVLITFLINVFFLLVYVIGAVLLIIFDSSAYDTIFDFILTINYPLFLQLPTITVVYSFKCSYVSLITTGLQGMLLNYLRRIDKSWSTSIYLVIGIILFFLGSIVWIGLSFVTSYILQFRMANIGIIMTPVTIIVVIIFARRRSQAFIIWTGKFYDQQFNDRSDLNVINDTLNQRRSTVLRRNSNFNGLRLRQLSFMTNVTVTTRRQTDNQIIDLFNSKRSAQENDTL